MLSTIYLPWYIPWYILWYISCILWWYVASLVRAQGQPLRKFHFFAKNLENRQYFTFLAIFDLFLMYLGPETYITFESRTGAKFRPSMSSSLARDEKL